MKYCTLQIKELNPDVPAEDIEDLLFEKFSHFGDVKIKIIPQNDGNSVAYITFENADDAHQASRMYSCAGVSLFGVHCEVLPVYEKSSKSNDCEETSEQDNELLGLADSNERHFEYRSHSRETGRCSENVSGESEIQLKESNDPVSFSSSEKKTTKNGPNHILYISFDAAVKEEDIYRCCRPYGNILDVTMKHTPTGAHFAFVTFLTVDMATCAKETLRGKSIGHCHRIITTGYGSSTFSRILWVGGIGPWTSIELLRTEFSQFGEIENIVWPEGRDYAYVVFDADIDAKDALVMMNGCMHGNPPHKLRIVYAEERQMTSQYNNPTETQIYPGLSTSPVDNQSSPCGDERRSYERLSPSPGDHRSLQHSRGRYTALECRLVEQMASRSRPNEMSFGCPDKGSLVRHRTSRNSDERSSFSGIRRSRSPLERRSLMSRASRSPGEKSSDSSRLLRHRIRRNSDNKNSYSECRRSRSPRKHRILQHRSPDERRHEIRKRSDQNRPYSPVERSSRSRISSDERRSHSRVKHASLQHRLRRSSDERSHLNLVEFTRSRYSKRSRSGSRSSESRGPSTSPYASAASLSSDDDSETDNRSSSASRERPGKHKMNSSHAGSKRRRNLSPSLQCDTKNRSAVSSVPVPYTSQINPMVSHPASSGNVLPHIYQQQPVPYPFFYVPPYPPPFPPPFASYPQALGAGTNNVAAAAVAAAAGHTNVPLLPSSQIELDKTTIKNDVATRYLKVWSGALVLKNGAFVVDMHLVGGNVVLVDKLLRNASDPGSATDCPVLKIAQRLRLDQPDKLKELEQHLWQAGYAGCTVLIACPAPAQVDDDANVIRQHPLGSLVSYLLQKQVAAVVPLPPGCEDQRGTTGILHAFPPCQFSHEILRQHVPELSSQFLSDDQLLVVICTT